MADIGITPAHAGKRSIRFDSLFLPWDHPRACGEKKIRLDIVRREQGSPPRMRGKERVLAFWRHHHGITPAHAGKRDNADNAGKIRRDHPRACGEKISTRTKAARGLGSPPRMRGKAPFCIRIFCMVGITPAHAGKSIYGVSDVERQRDHPRACGEKFVYCDTDSVKMGSPPRMRGKVLCVVFVEFFSGITPAHAGKRLRK